MRQASRLRTRYGVPCEASHCALAAVMTSSGYSYFATAFLVALSRASFASFSLRPSSGSASRTFSPSRFVTKPVRTTAPFS